MTVTVYILMEKYGSLSLNYPCYPFLSGALATGSAVIAQQALNKYLPYFFDYKMEFFLLQNIPKNLDPFYKTDLDLWDCL